MFLGNLSKGNTMEDQIDKSQNGALNESLENRTNQIRKNLYQLINSLQHYLKQLAQYSDATKIFSTPLNSQVKEFHSKVLNQIQNLSVQINQSVKTLKDQYPVEESTFSKDFLTPVEKAFQELSAKISQAAQKVQGAEKDAWTQLSQKLNQWSYVAQRVKAYVDDKASNVAHQGSLIQACVHSILSYLDSKPKDFKPTSILSIALSDGGSAKVEKSYKCLPNPTIPYQLEALEPILSKDQVHHHFNVHHKSYHAKALSILDKHQVPKDLSLKQLKARRSELIPDELDQTQLFNCIAQIEYHNLYWQNLLPYKDRHINSPGSNCERLARINNYGPQTFQNLFKTSSMNHFGSGWFVLTVDQQDRVFARTVSNAQTIPGVEEKKEKILFVIDLWQHSWYLDYQSNKKEYVDRIFQIFDYRVLERRILKPFQS